MNQTLTMLLLFFIMLSLLVFSYTTATGPEIASEREAIKETLSRPAFKPPITQEENNLALAYLTRNANFLDPNINATSVFVWDGKINKIFFSKESKIKRPIASITKLLTSSIVLENANLNEEVKVSAIAVEQEGDTGNLRTGETLTIEALLNMTLLESSNDASVALAEYIGEKITGTVGREAIENFVLKMNEKASEIGLEDSYFTDPSGLNDTNSFSTAQDVAGLVFYIRENPLYADIWQILKQEEAEFTSAEGDTHIILNNNPFVKELSGVVGGKTGYTTLAGGSMVLLVKTPDKKSEIMYIVLGSDNRFGDIRSLVNWVSSAYIWQS